MLMRRAGVTLVELLISLALFSVVMTAAVSVTIRTQRSYMQFRHRASAGEALRMSEIAIQTVLRSAGANPRNTNLTFLHPNPLAQATFDNVRVVSDFNPADGDVADPLEDVLVRRSSDTLLVRWQAGQPLSPVAYPVRSLLFQYYSADGTPLTTLAQIVGATRVRVRMTVPAEADPSSIKILRRDLWVYLRNR